MKRAAIYFDGCLPSYKIQERLGRVCENSNVANEYFLSTSSGIGEVSGQKFRQRDKRLPKPAFIVPAVLEALKSLERYGQVTHLVPGEADPFCAQDVRQNGGILLTADSDLLLYDLGPTGSVVYFHDLTPAPGSNAVETAEGGRRISALTYRQSEICQRFSLKLSGEGLLPLGFEVKQGSWKGTWAPQTTWQYLAPDLTSEYRQFVSQYLDVPALHDTIPEYMRLLDPRVSEFVSDVHTAKPGTPAANPVVHLPLLLDRWDRTSAWNPSTAIRQLAYSLCQGSSEAAPVFVEYRRTMSLQSKGQNVEMLDRSEAPGALHDLLNYISGYLEVTTGPKRLQWITACLGLEIGHAAEEDRESTALKLWHKAVKAEGLLDPNDWDAVHLAAHIQGALYSFRMLRQVLNCGIAHMVADPSLNDLAARLETCLSSLPPIAEFVCVSEMGNLFEELHEAGSLGVLAKILGIPEPTASGRPAVGSTNRKKQQKRAGDQPQPRFSSSANPFDALSIADW